MKKRLARVPLQIDSKVASKEIVIAEPAAKTDEFRLRSIPAFAYGVAPGDLFRLEDRATGRFSVVERGGQVSIRLFVAGAPSSERLTKFERAIESQGGLFEIGRIAKSNDGTSILLASLNVELGISEMTNVIKALDLGKFKWEFGNVYDEFGQKELWLTNT